MGWGSIYKRRMKVFTVALIIYLDYKAFQKREKWIRETKRAALWEIVHERNARRLLNLIIELEGLWVKLGQYLSTRADVLPQAYICLLKQLQDSMPPRPLKEVRHTIETELGQSMDDLFSDFDDTPLATASIAQVHRAILRDGQQVVVKVQHEGIKAVIIEDLKNAKAIVDWIAWAEPQYDFRPLIDEWFKEAPKELDFNREADNTKTVSKNLDCKSPSSGSGDHINVLIPEVIRSTEKLLILEFMDGVRLNDNESLERLGVDKQRIVEEITRAYAHQIYVDGFFNGDPHPGNFLVSREPPHCPILLDFGLTKSISSSTKQALAKMFLACAEGDHVALLSAFAEIGLRLRVDMPEQAMEITNIFFRNSTPADDHLENLKALAKDRNERMKAIQEKMKQGKKKSTFVNPVDAFPGDAVIFVRVLNLLRGLSAILNVRIIYLDILRPFAEATLLGNQRLNVTPEKWIYEKPVLSRVEAKLRQLLLEIGHKKILGIQVCAYKDGKVIIDTAAGTLGRYDPRPVQPDSLFPVFSATKGITAGMIHWLVDKGKLKFDENVASIWPDFGSNGKKHTKIFHVLNHTTGLHNAMGDVIRDNPLVITDWSESLKHIARATPETEPGFEQKYHYLSFGWICGGIIEHASGKRFQDILEEAIVHPLNIEGELYIGIPPGVESRLATLTIDTEDLEGISNYASMQGESASLNLTDMRSMISNIPVTFNMLPVRRAIIPAANGHCSARALARYYAALAAAGKIPPPHTGSDPPLGSHPHIPKFPSQDDAKKAKGRKNARAATQVPQHSKDSSSRRKGYTAISTHDHDIDDKVNTIDSQMFTNPRVHDAFMGAGEYYGGMVTPNGKFGLGFRKFPSERLACFGHSGIGGSTGFCDVENQFAMAITVNKMSFGSVTRKIVQLVCTELQIPVPDEFSISGEKGPDMQFHLGRSAAAATA